MNEGEAFIRDAAIKRGIDPDIAVKVAMSEGGTMPPGNVGKFDTGWSFWQFQLHYAMAGQPGVTKPTVGMGEGFTVLTGWQPGVPEAWADSVRYALNRAKASGWGAWYGAAHVGVGRWDGIDRTHPWEAAAEPWDYETGAGAVPKVTYNASEPNIVQSDNWSCAPTALRWAMHAVGRKPAEAWIEDTMIQEGVVSKADGLLDASGAGLAAFVRRQYGEFGYDANNEAKVSFAALAAEIGPYPMLIGGRTWGSGGHWSGVRGYDPASKLLLLANPAEGWGGIGQTMSRAQWDARGPWSMVRVLHPDLLAAVPPPPPPPPIPPIPPLPPIPTLAEIARELRAVLAVPDDVYGGRALRQAISAVVDKIPPS